MKIASAETIRVSLPPRRAHRVTFDTEGNLGHYVILKVLTDEGVFGLGEATVLPMWGGDHMRYFGESPGTTVHIVNDYLLPAIKGRDPFDIEAIHAVMDRTVKGFPYAKAAVDMALYDIMGKALGVPAYQLLGGLSRREVPMAHSLGIMEVGAAVEEAAAAVKEGIRTIKVKVGIDRERDVATVRELRGALGEEIEITVDANQGYPSPKVAIQTIERMCEYGISMAEQPVEGMDGMAEVREAVPCLVMADESAWTPWDILEIRDRGAADVFSLYTTKPGGLFKAKESSGRRRGRGHGLQRQRLGRDRGGKRGQPAPRRLDRHRHPGERLPGDDHRGKGADQGGGGLLPGRHHRRALQVRERKPHRPGRAGPGDRDRRGAPRQIPDGLEPASAGANLI